LITLQNISFSYNGTKENNLSDISLHIPKGQCVLLCGGSGCGKTTVTRLINGLIPHFFEGKFSGEAIINGMNSTEADIAQLSDSVGTVFQNPRTQFFNTDTDSEIVFGLENRGLSPEQLLSRLKSVTEDLQIQNLRARSIFELSGGEKQKIAFASVYAAEPDIFVLDEPSSNMDYRSIKELRALIGKTKQQGKTIVIAEHRIWYVMDIADRVIFMANGKIARDMDIQTFINLSEAQIKCMELRCRNLADVKVETVNVTPDISASSDARISSGRHTFEVKDITVKFGHTSVLQNISFTAAGGEIIAITGENGAGKTTLARTLCGLTQEETGSISIDGTVLSRKMRRERSYMVMQDVGHQLFTDSVYAECRLGIKDLPDAAIDGVLTELSLDRLKERHPLSLSGGQKQRLAVAVSVLCGKDILIFDEPTSGLDLKSMQEAGRIIRRLADDKKIVIVITHDIEFIKTICSRVLILSGGKIIKELRGAEKNELEMLLGGD